MRPPSLVHPSANVPAVTPGGSSTVIVASPDAVSPRLK
jgi:hypothetical protein